MEARPDGLRLGSVTANGEAVHRREVPTPGEPDLRRHEMADGVLRPGDPARPHLAVEPPDIVEAERFDEGLVFSTGRDHCAVGPHGDREGRADTRRPGEA